MHFFTDLDNTVLYSHRHMISDPVVWVETLNEKAQSFISENTYNYYLRQDWLNIIPVTTRTVQQYDRLKHSLSKLGWNEALVCNGAVRIIDGEEDAEWTAESVRLSKPSAGAFLNAYQAAEKEYGSESVVLSEPFLFYIKGANAESAFRFLSSAADKEHLTIYKDSRKVYCIPRIFSKGSAIKRYKSRFGVGRCIAAGDSDFDIPLLQQADICLFPQGLAGVRTTGRKIVCEGLFSDRICIELEKIRKEEVNCD